MSDKTVDQLVEELVEEAQAGNTEAATRVLEDIADRFGELRTSERVEIRASAAARRSDGVKKEAIKELAGHIQEGANTQMSRAAFLLEAVAILRELEEEQSADTSAAQVEQQTATEALSELGDRIQTQQNEYEETAEAAAKTTDDVDVPAQVSVESIAAPNTVGAAEEFTVDATVQNVGDEPAQEVDISVELYEDGNKKNELTTTIGTLAGGEKTSNQWSEISGTETVIVTVKSSNGGSDASETDILITEEDTEPGDPSVADYTNDEGVVDTGGLREASDDWRGGDIDTDTLDKLVEMWESGEVVN